MHTGEFDEIAGLKVGDAEFPPDEAQQRVIKSIDNTVVSAGAGSGKTEVLASRFAYLLMTDSELRVKNILAITFTKKAAAEIYARVFKKLNDYKNTLSEKRFGGRYEGEGKPVELAKRALAEFSDARIQTLDSYSNDVVKLAVARYGIKPDYSVGESAGDIRNMAKGFALRFIADPAYEAAYQTYSQAGRLEDFAKTYFAEPVLKYTSLATPRGWFSENLKEQARQVLAAWNEAMGGGAEGADTPEAIRDAARAAYESLKPADQEKYKCAREIIYAPDSLFVELDEAAPVSARTAAAAKPFAEWLDLEKPGAQSKIGKLLKPLRRSKDEPFNLYGKFAACRSFIENYAATEQLCRLMDLFLEEVNAKKKRAGILSFKDISELALRVLREQSDILAQQRSLIKKIMIDEFQDNNAKNKELLDLLAGGSREKLFFVGDEKQSIYKFRGADVSVFNELKGTLKGADGGPCLLQMTNNYRSDAALLKAFNELFGDDGSRRPAQRPEAAPEQFYDMPALFYFDDYLHVPEYEAKYRAENYATKPGSDGADAVAPIDLAETGGGAYRNVKIHACVLHSGKNQADGVKFSDMKKQNAVLDESETAAFFIAKKIKELVAGGAAYSDFAILDSSRTHRGDLQKFLTMENIPFSVDVQKNIFAEGIVNDFYNFLRICIYPNDTNAFAAFLTSPFVCMSQTGAQNLMAALLGNGAGAATQGESGETELAKNFAAFSGGFDANALESCALSADDQAKYVRAKAFYESEKRKILSSGITKTVERLWYETGYFYEAELNAGAKICGEQFDLLYQIALQAENQGEDIGWFIDQLAITKEAERAFNAAEDADLETDDVHYPLEKQNAVTVMTIHQSKGLEFGTVFVTGVFGNPKAEKSAALYFEEKLPGALLARGGGGGGLRGTGVSLRANDGSQNYFFLRNKEDSAAKSLAEQKRLIYVAITRARHEVFLVGDLAESDKLKKLDKDQNPSLMHKILRHYYCGEKGLYQDNDYSAEALAAMCARVPAEEPHYNAAAKAPFDFVKINPVSAKARANARMSAAEERRELREWLGALFCGREALQTPEMEACKSFSPSGLEELEHGELPQGSVLAAKVSEIRAKGQNGSYAELDSFFAGQSAFADGEEKSFEDAAGKAVFGRGTFGTMAHAYLEHWVKTGALEHAENPATFKGEIAKALDENFSKAKRDKLSAICKAMAGNFAASALGARVAEAKAAGRICKAENEFKMALGGALLSGSIDLFFENADGTFTLVDYKTNAEIRPETFFEQQACYKLALERIYAKSVGKCFLYFLRFDAELDITAEVEALTAQKLQAKLEELAQGA